MAHTDPPSTSVSTPDRLLDAAERLFLEKGADRVSVRAVNAEAGLNPGAVHYHFGSREGLVAALLERELRPVWEGRLRSLSPDGEGGPIGVEALVAAVVHPFEELSRTDKGRMLCHLLARESLPSGGAYSTSPWFTASPFEVMLARVLPDLSAREIAARWRLTFTLLLEVYGRPLERSATAAGTVPETATVVAFLTAGLSAPAPDGESR